MEGYGYEENPQQVATENKPSIGLASGSRKKEDAFSHVFKDADQVAKYDAIVELLLAAGYFRARISTLSHFDKVIGGLTWCISSSQVDVDIDLFFQEDSTMGMKIQLGEVIEKTLTRMRCPHPLRSHQIRGLDFINIHPVIQWLVTKVLEVRKETGDLLRTVSEWQFGKKYSLPSDEEFEARKGDAATYAKGLVFRYRPSRKYRSKGSSSLTDEEDRVQSTLLEYGHKAYRSVEPKQEKRQLGSKNSQAAKLIEASMGGSSAEDVDAAAAARDADEKRFQRMLQNMEEGGSTGVSDNVLAGLIGMESDDINRMEGKMEGFSSKVPAGMSGKQFEEEQHARRVDNLHKQIAALKEKLLAQKNPHHELAGALQQIEGELSEKAGRNQHIIDSLEKFDSMVTDENRDDIETLRALVLLNENLKKQDEQFRLNCKRQLQSLNEKIKQIQDTDPGSMDTERDKLIKDTHEKDLDRLVEHRQALGKKIRDIAMVERKIDEIPSRSELQQYQLQLVELYEQVAAKLTETRKYYQSYNTLNATLTYLTKEISLINSINENYKPAMKSKKNKDAFLQSLDDVVGIANQNLEKTDQKISEEKQVLNDTNVKYQALVNKERTYHKLVKEFEVECERNEKLLAQVGS